MEKILKFEKGKYSFCEYFPSNNDGGEKKIAFHLRNEKDIVFDGCGANFCFDDGVFPIVVDGCENITLRNFSIDYKHPQHFEGRISLLNEKGFLCQARAGYSLRVEDGKLMVSSGGEERAFTCIFGQAFDVDKKAPYQKQNATMLKFWFGDKKPEEDSKAWVYARPEQKEEGVFFHAHKNDIDRLQLPLGCVLAFSLSPRVADAIFILNSKNIKLENVNIYRSTAMGVIAQLSENITLKNLNVKVKEGRADLVSSSADATHFVNCYGEVRMEDCSFYNMLDDATNIHGTYGKVVEVRGKTAKIQLMHPQQKGVLFVLSGDSVKFLSPKTFEERVTLKAIKSELSEDKEYIEISFAEELDGVLVGDIVDNISAMPEIFISRCSSGNNRPRGFLLTSGKRTEVTECLFENSRSAIHVSSDSENWFESGSVNELIIRNNHFKNCNYSTGFAALTILSPAKKDGIYVHRNITVSDNLVEIDKGGFLELYGAESVRIERNRIKDNFIANSAERKGELINIKNCKDVQIDGEIFR